MPTFKLDGQDIPFEPGDTVIRAAWRQGHEIPHYCWHPGLSIAANCRMCLVEIKSGRTIPMPVLRWDEEKQDYVQDTKPKLQPACQTPAAEGMEISSKGAEALSAQASVQEFLLLNHPVDCPICDQAGECKLQDYWLDHQQSLKRKHTEPVHKPKGVVFGPKIVYDAERCIMCTRCIRVCDELVGDHVLDMRERGNKNEIVLAPGRELDHQYSLMTEHVCPVGALTSRDFRFKARVWFLKSEPSVCPGCATGCNMHADYDPRNQHVYRLRPRDNLDVNQFWMCDDGMMTYKRIHEGRIYAPWSGRGSDRLQLDMAEAFDAIVAAMKAVDPDKLAVVFSAQHSVEDNFALRQLQEKLGVSKTFMAALGGWEGDDVLRHADNNPNRAGVRQVAPEANESLETLTKEVSSGVVEAVLVLGGAAAQAPEQLNALARKATVITLSSNHGPLTEVASHVFPVCSWAEMEGTFVNAQGMAQRFSRVIHAPHGIVPAWRVLGLVGQELGLELPLSDLGELRAALQKPAPVREPAAAEARA